MQDHWQEFGPPVYMAVAAYMGLMKKPKPGSKGGGALRADSPENEAALEELFGSFPGGVIEA